MLALLLAVSAMPQLADALDETRGAEPAAGAADGQSYGWGDTVFTETLPDPPEADAEAVEAAEEDFLAEMEETFRWYAARRYGPVRRNPPGNRMRPRCAVGTSGARKLSKTGMLRKRASYILYGKSPRQSFAARRRRKKVQICFFRGHAPRKKHISGSKCAARRAVRVGACIPSPKCLHFGDSVSSFSTR